MKELEEYRSGHKIAESVQQRLKELTESNAKLADFLEKAHQELKEATTFREALTKFLFPNGLPTPQPMVLPTDMPTSAVGLQRVVTVVELEEIKKHAPKVPTDTVKGKILALAREGFFSNWQSIGDVNTKLVDVFRFNISDQAINAALKELVDERILGMKHTDRNRWKLAPDVVFEGKEVEG
jgi:hypothetical protein